MTTAAITCFEVGRRSTSLRLRCATSAAALQRLDSGGRVVPLTQLSAAKRWSPLFRRGSGRSHDKSLVPLGEIVRVSRGAVTGNNSFFTMSSADARTLSLTSYVVPVLTSAHEIFGADGTISSEGLRRVLLDPPRSADVESPDHPWLRRYVRQGEQQGVHRSYICSHRRPWWHVGAKFPPIVATYMARQAPAFALNPGRVAILNVLHGLFPKVPLDEEQLLGLVGYLNRHRQSLRGHGRTYQGGLEKFEPSEMEAIEVPPPQALPRYAGR